MRRLELREVRRMLDVCTSGWKKGMDFPAALSKSWLLQEAECVAQLGVGCQELKGTSTS